MSGAIAAESLVAPEQRRGTEQTYLTYPEWFLVHSPAEYAVLVNTRPATDFPFMTHVAQLWSSYEAVTGEQLRDKYPLNAGYHAMILVIASSTTVEYVLRAAYENTIGRVSFLLGGQQLTAEDKFAAEAAQDYVDFIRQQPWYLFDFTSRLKALWTGVPLKGPGFIRKLERRYALTTEYLIKAVYGKMIEKATRATYEPALMTTRVVLNRAPVLSGGDTDIKIVKVMPDGRAVADLPRYYNFRIAATNLARQGVDLIDVAGNTSDILVTVWAPDNMPYQLGHTRLLFTQTLITRPGQSRLGLVVPVAQLSNFLLHAPEHGMIVEHVYDY
ncbi:hypothetical protein D0T23_08380 [Duganella sp. BJB475]|nr:hypothetical protein D0T23_08380 [Duganella sp. BJB475]RFP33151.1 hypothetical protein D0T21_12250 [Duganella sp. BJB476]